MEKLDSSSGGTDGSGSDQTPQTEYLIHAVRYTQTHTYTLNPRAHLKM